MSIDAFALTGDLQVMERYVFSAVLSGAEPATAQISQREVVVAGRAGFGSAMWSEFDGQLVVLHVDGPMEVEELVPLVTVGEIPPGE